MRKFKAGFEVMARIEVEVEAVSYAEAKRLAVAMVGKSGNATDVEYVELGKLLDMEEVPNAH